MSDHAQLLNDAKDAINRLVEDTSVPGSQTINDLQHLKDEIDSILDSLED